MRVTPSLPAPSLQANGESQVPGPQTSMMDQLDFSFPPEDAIVEKDSPHRPAMLAHPDNLPPRGYFIRTSDRRILGWRTANGEEGTNLRDARPRLHGKRPHQVVRRTVGLKNSDYCRPLRFHREATGKNSAFSGSRMSRFDIPYLDSYSWRAAPEPQPKREISTCRRYE